MKKHESEKDKHSNSIIEMGVLMNYSRIPMSYNIFLDNESNKASLRPIQEKKLISV